MQLFKTALFKISDVEKRVFGMTINRSGHGLILKGTNLN